MHSHMNLGTKSAEGLVKGGRHRLSALVYSFAHVHTTNIEKPCSLTSKAWLFAHSDIYSPTLFIGLSLDLLV